MNLSQFLIVFEPTVKVSMLEMKVMKMSMLEMRVPRYGLLKIFLQRSNFVNFILSSKISDGLQKLTLRMWPNLMKFLHVIFCHESLRIMHGKSEFHGINNSKHNEIENKITGIQTKSDLDIYRKLNSHALTIKDLFDSERQFLHNSNLSIFLIIKNTFDSKKLSIFAMPFSLSTIKKIYDLKYELINNWNKSIFFDDKDHVQFQGRRILCLLCSLFIDDNEYIRFQEEFFCGCNSDILFKAEEHIPFQDELIYVQCRFGCQR